MRRFNFDEIDDIALQVVRADMARAHGDPMPQPAEEREEKLRDPTGKFPILLIKQAG